MTYSTLEQTLQQTVTVQPVQTSTAQEPHRPRLVAEWHVIDGKLTCRWNLV